MKKRSLLNQPLKAIPGFLLLAIASIGFTGCEEEVVEDEGIPLPVLTLKKESAALEFKYLGSIEGVENVQIRPQVDGVLEEIYVDEGQYVKKGQPLFKINGQPYVEDLKNALANVDLEKAKLRKAQTEIDRLKPLIENEVISAVRMETTQADYEVAQSSLAKAEAEAANMRINLAFTTIKAPVDGLMGRIPKSIGNLVKKTDGEPLTVLSNVHEIYVYFSMSESDYLYYERMKKDSTSKKMNPDVKLVLADGSVYNKVGTIDANSGQINRSTGSITLRAHFQNPDTLLRTGNTGKILMEQIYPNAILVPQSATTSIQDKRFVFLLKPDNTVERKEITIEGRTGNQFIVSGKSLNENDRIVTAGLEKISEGVKIKPLEQGHLLSQN
ncbi:efflux RND transporter periplasmic adaptor subunit [Algoriphagus zhangzhouensis]|uniref:Membrane fusion protein, multidrug efflux system n=1 Tax=Algoriphagus zhangzhouensis TaxID=1073327 RepID=A0A1M7ZH12_9BACT|nr:efflux RND transporter periplasmic adaptor subunit [Algoriphagus zhangzhouensis]TDY44081.1 membrane fusion protein (multidrug efflux system) [Algoriphagus zhangzhouensis]SHO64191.1 membrane fusion protein, multidrug efflux system [Algoriphagus zhangzhouensis]